MLIELFSLTLNALLIFPISQSELFTRINDIRAWDCAFVSSCIRQSDVIGQNPQPNNPPNSTNDKKTCKDEGKDYQEGQVIKRHGVDLVCKEGRFVPKADEDSN